MFRRFGQRRVQKTIGFHSRNMFAELLEDRRLLAGDSVAARPLVAQQHDEAKYASQANASVLVFVDSAVEGYEDFVRDLVRVAEPNASAVINDSELSAPQANVDVVILDGDRDGITQISEILSRYSDVSAIHVLSHGSTGSLQLGNTHLNRGNLEDYATQLGAWKESLALGADILLYGCNVAEGARGIAFVEDLAGAIDVDVAASTNLTGAAALGGDWILEASTGVIESRMPLPIVDYAGVLYDVCSDDNRCTHEEMAGYAGNVFFANGGSSELNIAQVRQGAGHEDEVDHIYGWHTSPIPGSVTFTHFWDADAGPYAASHVDGPASVVGPFENSWQKAEQYWSLALGEYANNNLAMAYHFLGHIAHQMGDNTIPTHVHVSAHDPFSGDDSVEDWMSQGSGGGAPGSDLLPGEQDALNAAGALEIPLIPGRTDTPVGRLYWLLYTTNQIADFFPSDRAAGDTVDPEGWVQAELNSMNATISSPRTPSDLEDNDCNNPVVCIGPGDDDNNDDGDLGVIRQYSYLRGIRAIAGLYELFQQTVSTQPIVVVTIERVEELVGCSIVNEDCDFYSRVTIDGSTGVNEGDECFDCISQFGNNFFPNWAWGRVVGTSGSIPLKIEILDDDNVFSDGLVKIKHEAGTALDLTLDLAKCLSGEAGAITGAGIPGGVGMCGQSLITNASEDDEDVDDQGIARVTFSVKMSNPPPTADAGGPYTVLEGGSVPLSGAGSSDLNQLASSLTYEWDLDNNGSFETTGINPIFSAAVLDGPSSSTVRLRVTDSGGLSDTDEATVNIVNVPAVLQNARVTPVLDENGVATLAGNIVDPGVPDTFTLVVDWGEGTPQTFNYPAGTSSFSETHRYRDDNPTATPQDGYDITLRLSDDDSGTDAVTVSTLVKNSPPVITAFRSDAEDCGERAEGDAVRVTGMFTDVGTLDTHTATIAWGDGTISSATIVESGGVGTIAGAHFYAGGGIFRIDVTLTDDDTGKTTEQTFALVTGVGILGGQAQVVGTKLADDVNVSQAKSSLFKVRANFIKDSPRSLPASGVTSIAMILCAGNDQVTVAGNIALPTFPQCLPLHRDLASIATTS